MEQSLLEKAVAGKPMPEFKAEMLTGQHGPFLAKHGEKPVKWKNLVEWIELSAYTVMKSLTKYLRDHETRLKALEKAAANGPNLADAFRGAWMPGSVYTRGSLTVHDGSLWLALVDSDQRPGTTADWKMITKKGRDGKDLRP